MNNSNSSLWSLKSCVIAHNNTSINQSTTTSLLSIFYVNYGHLHGYLALVVCILGVVANAANIVVLTRRNMISPTNRILTWLAIADLITMAVYTPQIINYYVSRDFRVEFLSSVHRGWIYYSLFTMYVGVVFHTVACWLTVALAFFRYISIAFPARGPSIASMTNVNWTAAGIHIVVLSLGIPNSFTISVEECRTEATSSHEALQTFRIVQLDDMRSFDNVYFAICGFFFKIIPCLLLTVLTILLIIEMSKASARRKRLTAKKTTTTKRDVKKANQETRTTAMLLVIVMFFLLLETPQGVMMICGYFITNFYINIYSNLGDLIDMLSLLNNTVNFVFYTSMSSQFRQAFINVFCRCCINSRLNWQPLSQSVDKNKRIRINAIEENNEKSQLNDSQI